MNNIADNETLRSSPGPHKVFPLESKVVPMP